MKNTTLGRKATSDMKKNSGEYKPKTARDQMGDGEDFAFNGQMGDGVNGNGTNGRHAGNYAGLTMKENYGTFESSRRGNTSDQSRDRMEKVGPSATADAMKLTIATAKEGHPVGAMKTPRKFSNPDAINVGMKR
jgi:hypothetical protein